MKTKYRKKYGDSGIIQYLQYEVEVSHWLFWKKKEWHYIWRPYYSRLFERRLGSGSDLYVNHTTHNLDSFVKNYPDIDEWFKQAEIAQSRLEENVRREQVKYDNNSNKIENID